MPLLPRAKAVKSGGYDPDGTCPFPGGYPGQVLTKKGAEDCDVEWQEPAPSQVYYRGAFDTPEELYAARPVDVVGAYAVVFSTNTFFVWDKETNFWKNTGQTIQEGGIAEAPIDGGKYARCNAAWTALADDSPYRPQGLSPIDDATDVPVFLRLKLSAYAHPYNVPIGGSRWQIARDAHFTDLVFDRRQMTGASSTIVTTDDQAQPWLPTATRLYWRGLYIDLKDRESRWCDVITFTTAATVEADYILSPDIVSPPDEAWTPEQKLVIQLSEPVVIGNAIPDKSDMQVSITPDFQGTDIVGNYPDNPDPILLVDEAADYRYTPSPVYMKARQKDSVRNILSPWSAVPTVWLQRAFSDLCIGRETIVQGNQNYSRWIDKNGNAVSVPLGYWEDHPIWSAVKPEKWSSPDGNPTQHDMVRLPSFYADANSFVNGSATVHRLWVNPGPFEGNRGYLHPGFRKSPAGLRVAGALKSKQGSYTMSSYDVAPAFDNNAGGAIANIATINGSTLPQKVVLMDVHVFQAIMLLMTIEKATINIRAIDGRSGNDNKNTCFTYRGIRCLTFLSGYANQPQAVDGIRWVLNKGPVVAGGVMATVSILPPSSSTDYVEISTCVPEIDLPSNVSFGATAIHTGYSEILGAHFELYSLPKRISTFAENNNRYFQLGAVQGSVYTTDRVWQDMIAFGGRNPAKSQVGFGPSMDYSTSSPYSRFVVYD